MASDIEIIVMLGSREVKDDGSVKWHDLKRQSGIVTFSNLESAKEEALRLAGEMIDRA